MASRNSKRKLTAGIAAAGVLLLGGSAFTAGNTVADSVAGYGTSTISGAAATSVDYGLSADGTQINTATIVFTGDETAKTIQAGFGADALTTCTDKTYDGTTATTVVCTGFTASTADSLVFNVAVS